jgi:hypothetical protein
MIEVRKERLILYSLDVIFYSLDMIFYSLDMIFYNKDIGVEALKFVTTQQTKPKQIYLVITNRYPTLFGLVITK